MAGSLVLKSLSRSFIGFRKSSITLNDFRTGSSSSVGERLRILRGRVEGNFVSVFLSAGTRETKLKSSSTIPKRQNSQSNLFPRTHPSF